MCWSIWFFLYSTVSKDTFFNAILLGRGHEFLYEGCRKVDLIRFNVYIITMSKSSRTPTNQYFPLPQYTIDKATASEKTLTQIYERPDYGTDN